MSIGISSSSARLLHSGIHHINLTSFVFGPNHAPLPISAAFSRFLQHNLSRSTHIFITGGGRPPAILFRLVIWRCQMRLWGVTAGAMRRETRGE